MMQWHTVQPVYYYNNYYCVIVRRQSLHKTSQYIKMAVKSSPLADRALFAAM